jgi:hypothetical protein
MPLLNEFRDRDSVVNTLKACDWTEWFCNHRSRGWELADVVRISVGANTFRYFRYLPEQPSVVFRSWATRAITPDLVNQLCAGETQSEFDAILRRLVGSLDRAWVRAMGAHMKTGPAIKLPSLLLKHLCASTLVPSRSLDAATRFLHTPLDSYTLGAIRLVHNEVANRRNDMIPRGAGMGWISDWRQYKQVQATIQDCAAEAGVPCIAFDVLVWNGLHEANALHLDAG